MNKDKSVLVFTDGSVHDVSVSSGACAAVWLPVDGDDNEFDYTVSVKLLANESHP